jgi:ribonucleotide monophosphatase NagD (HAD superfamily)
VAFTNASNHTPAGVAAALQAAGLPLAAGDVLTPAVVGAEVIRERYGDRPVPAAEAVWAGADLFVTSDAGRFASSRGPVAGVAGFISSGLAHVTGQRYEVLGKPSAAAMGVAARRLGVPAHRILVVGDDLTLEARMARQAGAMAALITTGLHGEPDVATAAPADRPDLVLTGLPELTALWTPADATRHLDGVA